MTDKFNNICKQYKLDDTLYKIGEMTRDMYTKGNSMQQVPWYRKYGNYRQKGVMYVTAWDLNVLAYNLICNSNDYKSKVVKDNNELLMLLSEYQEHDNNVSFEKMDSIKDDDKLLFILFGHSQQQFWYQNPEQMIIQFNRNTEILLYIWKNINSSINIDDIVYNKFGFNAETLNKILVYLLGIGLNETDVSNKEMLNFLKNHAPDYISNNFKKVIQSYTANYELFRQDTILKENLLLTKPIVETDTNKLLIVNHYLLIKLLSDGLYWIIRNHFYEKNSQEFTNDFGIAFEAYLENILNYYLDKKSYYHPCNTNKHKVADWIIETDKFLVILEQKSTVASLTLKTMYPDMNNLRKYISKFNEAFNQLNETEKIYNSKIGHKKVMKLIVHYENLYVQNILKHEVRKSRDNRSEDSNIFFINIYELERLLYVLNTDINAFYKILEKMLEASLELSDKSRALNQIMDQLQIKRRNDYLSNDRDHFNNILNDLKSNR